MSKLENIKFQPAGNAIEENGGLPTKNRRKINFSIILKYVSLLVLVLQNAGQVLLIRHATTRADHEPFLKTVLVFFGEIFKCIASVFLLILTHGSAIKALKDLREHFIYNFLETLKVGVPALIYTIQNFLLYLAVENLDAGTYMVTYQLKTLTTALFTVLMLKRRLSIVQWLSLVILCGGVAIVQISAKVSKTSASTTTLNNTFSFNSTDPLLSSISSTTFSSANNTSLTTTKISRKDQNPLIGFVAVLTACFLSGFAGIYFEKILKGSDASLWLRNVQLAFLSIPIGVCMIAVTNGRQVMEHGLFQGFDLTVWIVVFVQAFGGLLVAVVIKYADNILKAFATSFAIVVSSVAAIFLFAHYPKLLFILGACLVILAVILYTIFPYKNKPDSSNTLKELNDIQIADKTETFLTDNEATPLNVVEDFKTLNTK